MSEKKMRRSNGEGLKNTIKGSLVASCKDGQVKLYCKSIAVIQFHAKSYPIESLIKLKNQGKVLRAHVIAVDRFEVHFDNRQISASELAAIMRGNVISEKVEELTQTEITVLASKAKRHRNLNTVLSV